MKTLRLPAVLALVVLAGWAAGEAATRAIKGTGEAHLQIGDRLDLTSEVVFDSAGQAKPLRDIVDFEHAGIFVVFRPACTACLGEAAVWNSLATNSDVRPITVLAETPDADFVRSFIRASAARFPVFRCDDTVLRELRPAALPVLVAYSEGRVDFTSNGPGGTDELRKWLKHHTKVVVE